MKILLKIKHWLIDDYNLETLFGCVLLYPAIMCFSDKLIPALLFLIGIFLISDSYRSYWKKYWKTKEKDSKEDKNDAE